MKNIKVLLTLLAMLCFSACAAELPTEEDYADEQVEIDSKEQALTTVTTNSYTSGQVNGPNLTTVGQVSEVYLNGGGNSRWPATLSFPAGTTREYRFTGLFDNTPYVGYRVLTPSCGQTTNPTHAPLKIEFCCRINGFSGSDAWTCNDITALRGNPDVFNDAGWCHGNDLGSNPRWDAGWGYVGRSPNFRGWPEYKYRVQYQPASPWSFNGQPLNQVIFGCNSSNVKGDIFVPYKVITRN